MAEERCPECGRELGEKRSTVEVPAASDAGPITVRSRPLHEGCAERVRDLYRAHGHKATIDGDDDY